MTNLDWRSIKKIQDYPDHEKLQTIQQRARMIEEKAERSEKLNRALGKNMSDAREVNDLLIDAIEAKLSILEDM